MPYCTRCGNKMGDLDIFCSGCGSRQASSASATPPPPFAPPPPPHAQSRSIPHRDPMESVSPRAASVLCYIPTAGWIAAVVVLASKKFRLDDLVRFHAFQGLYLFAIWLLTHWVIRPLVEASSDGFFRVDRIISGIVVATSIFMMIKASHDEAYVLPIIGELAQRSAAEK